MRAAIIAVTESGVRYSARIAALGICPCVRYAYEKYADISTNSFHSIYSLTAEIFPEFDALIFLCAAGIAVRAIAPMIRDKSTDPAVLILDEAGKFVIPVLSGHIGGANALANALAEALGAVPVITTATDSGGKFSPDSFAEANYLQIIELSAAKEIAAAILRKEPVGLVSAFPYENCPPCLHPGEACRTGLYIGYDLRKKPFPITLHLVPQDLVLGIGCKRGADFGQIAECVDISGIPLHRVRFVTSIDLKANEPGLIAFCSKHRLHLKCYPASALRQVQGEFTTSDFVRETVGVDNVCERSAVLGSGGTLHYCKFSWNGVTCAAASCEIRLDFAKRRDLD